MDIKRKRNRCITKFTNSFHRIKPPCKPYLINTIAK